MKRSFMQRIAAGSAIALLAITAGPSFAQDLAPDEVVVGAEVLSDEAVDGEVDELGGDGETVSGTYVGDIPCGVARYSGRRGYAQPDLFYNFYTQGFANRTNAQMYLSPVPVPPNVGHTFFTYQPFYPHEMLYWHKDRFHNYYDDGRGMNRTRVKYYSPPVRQALSNVYWNYLRLPR